MEVIIMSIKINTEIKRPSKEVVEGFRSLLKKYHSITPGVSDVMNRLSAMTPDIKPLFEGIRVVGVALTVRTIAGDNSALMRALAEIQSGDMIVVDTHNSKDTAFWGELVCIEAQRKGSVGIILDSAIRDVIELRKMKFPVLCQGITPNGGGKAGFGYINFPIQCGGVVVNSGDVVIVDDNGVVVVPQNEAEDILQKTARFLENETKVLKRVMAGESIVEILDINRLAEVAIDSTAIYEKQRQSGNT
jgi:regulator of RNase E activity RraA